MYSYHPKASLKVDKRSSRLPLRQLGSDAGRFGCAVALGLRAKRLLYSRLVMLVFDIRCISGPEAG
jgi:hypothetical protein